MSEDLQKMMMVCFRRWRINLQSLIKIHCFYMNMIRSGQIFQVAKVRNMQHPVALHHQGLSFLFRLKSKSQLNKVVFSQIDETEVPSLSVRSWIRKCTKIIFCDFLVHINIYANKSLLVKMVKIGRMEQIFSYPWIIKKDSDVPFVICRFGVAS